MNLLVDGIRHALEGVIVAKRLKGRAHVAMKTNARGQLVIAIVMDETYPGEFAPRTSQRGSR